jgi:hypothetical protein
MVKQKIHTEEWAAGFLEGEGYIGFKYSLNKQYNKQYPRLVLSISQVHREPLDAFKNIFNKGTVRGPYGPYHTTKQSYYQYQISGDGAVEIIEKMLPYLFQKGIQAQEAVRKYRKYLNDKT